MTHNEAGGARPAPLISLNDKYFHQVSRQYRNLARFLLSFQQYDCRELREDMHFSITRLPFMRRADAASKPPEPNTRPINGLGRALQDAIDWNVQSRERRKRLGLE